MRRIINSTYITIDGVIQDPQDWPSVNGGDDGVTMQTELLFACDAVLMGRYTYDSFASAWPTRSGDPYSARINAMPKYVVSSTLHDPPWTNTTVISGDVVPEIERLKDQPGQDIVQYGFGQLSYTLMEHGLLDELRLWVHPFFLGSGDATDLLFRQSKLTKLQLADTTTLKNGIVILNYRVGQPDA
jgi:dihydrofolate reductase